MKLQGLGDCCFLSLIVPLAVTIIPYNNDFYNECVCDKTKIYLCLIKLIKYAINGGKKRVNESGQTSSQLTKERTIY
jgi:hypothetical protein